MKNPLVSVIIPYYNKKKYISETVQSVLNQSFGDFEIIIVNDGSQEEIPLSVIRKTKDSRLIIFEKVNEGVSKARNYGVEKAKGEYLLFLDADDKISSEFLEESVKVLNSNAEVAAVSTRVQLFGNKKGDLIFPNFNFELLLARNILVITCLIRKRQFLDSGGFDENMATGFEDWDFWISYLSLGDQVFYLDKVSVYYRIISSSRNHILKAEDFSQLRKLILNKHSKLYAFYQISPIETFEYKLIEDSREYKLGKIILKPVRLVLSILRGLGRRLK